VEIIDNDRIESDVRVDDKGDTEDTIQDGLAETSVECCHFQGFTDTV
jgi:hypothetical protein